MAFPVFKPCNQHQMQLLPPSLDELIAPNAMVRVIDAMVEAMDRSLLESVYPGGGASAYDPAMMLKVVLLAYAQGIYSSRKIARATEENIAFMWLCGLKPLDHNTVNRFRTDRIRPIFEDIFYEVVAVLAEAGYVSLGTYFLDGTKIEANANKYSFVWKKSCERYQEALRVKVAAHLRAIDELEEEEEALAPEDPKQVDSQKISEAARKINERLKRKQQEGQDKDESAKEMKRFSKQAERDYLPRMESYEHKQEILGDRNSFSKTDTDATFMRMKDDPMQNGQLKAAYNIQAGTENQYILGSTVHQRPCDQSCTIDHLEHLKEKLGHLPENLVADAGYGSEETYAWLEQEGANAYVQHNESFRETRKKWREDPMRPANWTYLEEEDAYLCPEGRKLCFRWTSSKTSERGYVSESRIYLCEDCAGCSRRALCMKSQDPKARRRLTVSPLWSQFKKRASEMLHTEVGSCLRKRRKIDVETIFGDIKKNWGFNRFTLRGLEKVSHEWLLVACGHNLRKYYKAQLAEVPA